MSSDQHVQQMNDVSNVAYDIMTVLQNKLEAIAALEVYKEDAQERNDQDLAQFFSDIQQQDTQYVARLKSLLVKHLS